MDTRRKPLFSIARSSTRAVVGRALGLSSAELRTPICAASVHGGYGGAQFKSGQADRDVTAYSSSMNSVRDKCDERQTRIDGMIAEFRKAQARRAEATAVHADDHAVELQPDEEAVAAVAVSAAAPPISL